MAEIMSLEEKLNPFKAIGRMQNHPNPFRYSLTFNRSRDYGLNTGYGNVRWD